MDFFDLCAYVSRRCAQLQQQVDACARLGRSFEFPGCTMPAGCSPDRADLGFWRQGERYFLYLRPAVSYRGEDPCLADFFRGGGFQRFDSFPALLRHLPCPQDRREPASYLRLKETLSRRLVGQEEAVEAAAFRLYGHILKRAPRRPLSLIFYGPTCVGKSELAKAVAPVLNEYLARERYRLVWTELNTFTEAHSAYRLTGAPPGYAGYDDPPVLEQVRRCPHTVFLFDELDKAHPEVLKVFMSILDEGRCTAHREDEQGQWELDFRRCIFLFTTNTNLSAPRRTPGFSPPPDHLEQKETAGPVGLAQRLFRADEAARRALVSSGVLTEIAGRFTGLIGFQPLSRDDQAAVTARQISALGREYGLDIVQVDPVIAQALTPKDALSLRSTAGVLEGILTPLLLAQSHTGPLRLAGTVQTMQLLPAAPAGTAAPSGTQSPVRGVSAR